MTEEEMDKDFYCSASFYFNGNCTIHNRDEQNKCSHYVGRGCTNKLHKWPTPEQFKEEYLCEYPDDAAVWYRFSYNPVLERNEKGKPIKIDYDKIVFMPWYLSDYSSAKKNHAESIVCACTPWGKPPTELEAVNEQHL